MRNSWDIGPSEELVVADECCEVLWHRAKTPLKKYDKGKFKIKVTNNCRVYLERPYWIVNCEIENIYIYIYVKWIKNVRSKVWQLFIILPVPLGSKEAEGRRGIVCMRYYPYYPAGCHSDVGGVGARKACREIRKDEEGVGWLFGVARCFLTGFMERLS